MVFFSQRRWLRILLIVAAIPVGLIILAALALVIINPLLTPHFEEPEFRAMLDRQTSQGLHFEGHYQSVKRTGFATAESPEFRATNGVKAMKSLDAWDVTAKFNPWGILLRRWQLDFVHIKRGEVEVQTYKAKPDPKKSRPWYAIFMPDHMYLRQVTCETANVKWQLKEKDAGIFGTNVLITPHGRDFEYRAKGGELRTGGVVPTMDVQAIHLLITKKIFEIYQFQLTPPGGGSIHVTGKAGMKEDKHINAVLEFEKVALTPWLPKELQKGVRGRATGTAKWWGEEQTLEAGNAEGELRVEGGELINLELTEYLAAATARKSLEKIDLTHCLVKFRWKHPQFEISLIDLGAEGKFAMQGSVTLEKETLDGTLDIGLAPQYLDWLPRAKEEIFTREEDGLIWTKVRLSGTLSEPKNDLSPRLAQALKKDPAAATGLFFRGLGEWLEQKKRSR